MKEILSNEWVSSLVIFLFQIIFVYLRTINVIYTSEKKINLAVITGALSGLFWLFSMTIGVNSLLEGKWIPICAHLIGGGIGTYWAIKTQLNKDLL